MMQLLKISKNQRFFVRENGTPVFWLGDTVWELFHKMSREEVVFYLNKRREQQFNVIQAVILAESDDLSTGNFYGRLPLLKDEKGNYDPTSPDCDGDYSYWDHVDWIIKQAQERGIYVAVLPTWGDKFNRVEGSGPEIFRHDNAEAYGRWLGARYSEEPNIIWVLGGDRPLDTPEHLAVIEAMARGLRAGDGGRRLMTFHPYGGQTSSEKLHNKDWLDFNMIQSGHGKLNFGNYQMLLADRLLIPAKPVLDGEPRYEDHPVGFDPQNGFFDDYDTRQAAYWAALSGTCGHTYGHHSVWNLCTKPEDYFVMDWKFALDRPGAWQMQYLRKLMESHNLLELEPDQSILARNAKGACYQPAARGKAYAYIYSPCGLPVYIKGGVLPGKLLKASWYDPRNGQLHPIADLKNSGEHRIPAPSSGRSEDWVLVLESMEQ